MSDNPTKKLINPMIFFREEDQRKLEEVAEQDSKGVRPEIQYHPDERQPSDKPLIEPMEFFDPGNRPTSCTQLPREAEPVSGRQTQINKPLIEPMEFFDPSNRPTSCTQLPRKAESIIGHPTQNNINTALNPNKFVCNKESDNAVDKTMTQSAVPKANIKERETRDNNFDCLKIIPEMVRKIGMAERPSDLYSDNNIPYPVINRYHGYYLDIQEIVDRNRKYTRAEEPVQEQVVPNEPEDAQLPDHEPDHDMTPESVPNDETLIEDHTSEAPDKPCASDEDSGTQKPAAVSMKTSGTKKKSAKDKLEIKANIEKFVNEYLEKSQSSSCEDSVIAVSDIHRTFCKLYGKTSLKMFSQHFKRITKEKFGVKICRKRLPDKGKNAVSAVIGLDWMEKQ